MINPIPDIPELVALHREYMAMTGAAPTQPWNQSTYGRMVRGLIHHAPSLLAPTEAANVNSLVSWLRRLSREHMEGHVAPRRHVGEALDIAARTLEAMSLELGGMGKAGS